MIKHYFKIIFRNLLKSRVTTTINLLGIAIGFTVSILLFIYVKYELDTDKSLVNLNRIYRIDSGSGNYQSLSKINVIKNDVPGINRVTYFHSSWSVYDILKHKENNYILENKLFADSSFFQVFQYKVIYGDAGSCLKKPYSIVLTQSEKEKIFESENPIGKVVEIHSTGRGTKPYTVTAIVEDPPANSSIRFKSVLSISTYFQDSDYSRNQNHWGYNNYLTFALLDKNIEEAVVVENLNQAMDSKAPSWVKDYYGKYKLSALKGLYFAKSDNGDEMANGKKSVVILMAVIGLVILIIAGINYFNLAIAQFEKRILEIGINRSVGAAAHNISLQSFLETILISLIALCSSIGLIYISLPFYNQLTGVSLSITQIAHSSNLVMIIVLFFITMILFGLLPAIVVGRQKVIDILRGKNKIQHSQEGFRNGMVVFQFALAIALIGASIILYKQSQFLLHTDYGFDKDNVLCLRLNSDLEEKKEFLEAEFKKLSNVKEIAYGAEYLGTTFSDWGISLKHKGQPLELKFDQFYVSGNLFELLGVDLKSGKKFNDRSSRNADIIVNQSFVDKYGFDEKSDLYFFGNNRGKLIGVVPDFHYGSMYQQINPMVYVCSRSNGSIMYIKFASANLAKTKETLKSIQKIWNNTADIFPFNYAFLDEHYEKVYEAEINLMKILIIASALSILISSLGLFGIAMYLAEKRTKEIGVRKVNGAKLGNILVLINQNFIVKILIAFIVASPVVFLLTHRWLEEFAYKATIGFWPFLLAGIIVLITALLTVSWQSWRTARRNPVEALRYE